MYTVTSDTLLHLGLQNIKDLPEYSTIKKELGKVEESNTNNEDYIESNGD